MRGHIVKRQSKAKVKGKPAVYYYAVYYVGKKQKWEKAPYPGRKEDAQRLLNQRLSELDQGEYREIQKITFTEYTERWLRDYVNDPNHIKPSTANSYRRIIDKRLLPFFGDYSLTSITVETVEGFVAILSKEGLSPNTIQNQLVPLTSMFNAALRQGYMKTSPMPLVKKPRVRKKEMRFLSAIELRRFLEVVPDLWQSFFATAALTGMRLGELLAMRWKNLDCETGVYNVRERLYEGLFDTPKSEAGQRAIQLSPRVIEVMRAQRGSQAKEKIRRGGVYGDQDLVFCTGWGTPLVNLQALRKTFNDSLDAANCDRVRIHDLRHTYAALLIAQNANPKFIQRQMGHSSIQVTFDTYGHLMPDTLTETVKALDKQVFGT